MDEQSLEMLYISVRPYLDHSQVIRDFLDANADLEPGDLFAKASEMAASARGTERTDYQILANAVSKILGQ